MYQVDSTGGRRCDNPANEMIITHFDSEDIAILQGQIAEAQELEQANEMTAEYQAAAYQRGRWQALAEILEQMTGIKTGN